MPGALDLTGKTAENLVFRAELSVRPVDDLFQQAPGLCQCVRCPSAATHRLGTAVSQIHGRSSVKSSPWTER